MLAPLLEQRDPAEEARKAFALFAGAKAYVSQRDLRRVADEIEADDVDALFVGI